VELCILQKTGTSPSQKVQCWCQCVGASTLQYYLPMAASPILQLVRHDCGVCEVEKSFVLPRSCKLPRKRPIAVVCASRANRFSSSILVHRTRGWMSKIVSKCVFNLPRDHSMHKTTSCPHTITMCPSFLLVRQTPLQTTLIQALKRKKHH
jgi:hypothetical protein